EGEHAASHVVDLVVRVSSCLGYPGVSRRIIFKWVHEVAARGVSGAPAHGIESPVGWEIDANQAHANAWEIRTRRPASRAASGCASRRRGRRSRRRRRATALQDVTFPASSRLTGAVAEVLLKGGGVSLPARLA